MWEHRPVLAKEVLDFLQVKEGGIYLDGTIGLGGHTEAILGVSPSLVVIGVDKDEGALGQTKKRFKKEIGKRLFLFHGDFKEIESLKKMFPYKTWDGALLDLGVSSYQLGDPQRGFSFQKEGPLDMRQSLSQKETAYDFINRLSEKALADIFYKYGEEKFSRRIARKIIEVRERKPIRTTLELANLISYLIPQRKYQSHPATRVFQALRIAVNRELEGLEDACRSLIDSMNIGGRLIVLSFHSLEDRIIKQGFLRFENPCICPRFLPRCICGKRSLGIRITRKPVVPTEGEIEKNPRSRSAKMRVFERRIVPG